MGLFDPRGASAQRRAIEAQEGFAAQQRQIWERYVPNLADQYYQMAQETPQWLGALQRAQEEAALRGHRAAQGGLLSRLQAAGTMHSGQAANLLAGATAETEWRMAQEAAQRQILAEQRQQALLAGLGNLATGQGAQAMQGYGNVATQQGAVNAAHAQAWGSIIGGLIGMASPSKSPVPGSPEPRSPESRSPEPAIYQGGATTQQQFGLSPINPADYGWHYGQTAAAPSSGAWANPYGWQSLEVGVQPYAAPSSGAWGNPYGWPALEVGSR